MTPELNSPESYAAKYLLLEPDDSFQREGDSFEEGYEYELYNVVLNRWDNIPPESAPSWPDVYHGGLPPVRLRNPNFLYHCKEAMHLYKEFLQRVEDGEITTFSNRDEDDQWDSSECVFYARELWRQLKKNWDFDEKGQITEPFLIHPAGTSFETIWSELEEAFGVDRYTLIYERDRSHTQLTEAMAHKDRVFVRDLYSTSTDK